MVWYGFGASLVGVASDWAYIAQPPPEITAAMAVYFTRRRRDMQAPSNVESGIIARATSGIEYRPPGPPAEPADPRRHPGRGRGCRSGAIARVRRPYPRGCAPSRHAGRTATRAGSRP